MVMGDYWALVMRDNRASERTPETTETICPTNSSIQNQIFLLGFGLAPGQVMCLLFGNLGYRRCLTGEEV